MSYYAMQMPLRVLVKVCNVSASSPAKLRTSIYSIWQCLCSIMSLMQANMKHGMQMQCRYLLKVCRTDTKHGAWFLTCSELHLCSRLAGDQLLEVLHSQNEGMYISAGSHTRLPAAHGRVSASVVEQQHLPNKLAGAPKCYDRP